MQFTLRHFLLFVLFLSIPLTVLAYGQRLTATVRPLFASAAVPVVTALLMCVSALVLRPGPWRNLLASGLLDLKVLWCSVGVPLLAVIWRRGPGTAIDNTLLIGFAVTAGLFSCFFPSPFPYIPRRCPTCGRLGLAPGDFSGAARHGAPPDNGSKYLFRWCGRCESRFKCRRLSWLKYAEWESASSASDDCRYWHRSPALPWRGGRR